MRRLDDGDLLRYRALAREDVVVVEVPGCAMDRSRQLKRVAENPERSQSDWEAMLDIWTLAVTAVNAHRAIVPVTREQIEGARIAAVTALPDSGRVSLTNLNRGDANAFVCARVKLLERMRLDAPPDASLVLMREYLATYASLTMATHTYRIDESLQYPHEAKRADVNGTQTIRMHVDANGKVTRVETIASQLTPTTIARVDGTTIASRDLFEREVAAYMQVAGYPPRVKNGKPVATVFELPIVWQLEK